MTSVVRGIRWWMKNVCIKSTVKSVSPRAGHKSLPFTPWKNTRRHFRRTSLTLSFVITLFRTFCPSTVIPPSNLSWSCPLQPFPMAHTGLCLLYPNPASDWLLLSYMTHFPPTPSIYSPSFPTWFTSTLKMEAMMFLWNKTILHTTKCHNPQDHNVNSVNIYLNSLWYLHKQLWVLTVYPSGKVIVPYLFYLQLGSGVWGLWIEVTSLSLETPHPSATGPKALPGLSEEDRKNDTKWGRGDIAWKSPTQSQQFFKK